MAIRNFWSLEPGEAILAEELYERFNKKLDLYFPLKDTGIDLLAVSKSSARVIAFQIKESRYYEEKNHSTWHQEDKKRLDKNKDKTDFYVFVIYLPGHLAKPKKKNKFEIHFVIIPIQDLLEKIKFKKPNKRNKYNFYFSFQDNNKLIEIRERKEYREDIIKKYPEAFNYSKYLNAWNFIEKKL